MACCKREISLDSQGGGGGADAHRDICDLMTALDSGSSTDEKQVRIKHLPAGVADERPKPCRAGHAALEERDDPRRQ